MVTARDVARRARVSTSTVSHVVNRTRPVSDAVRDRVETAMAELRYEPNAVARSLKVNRSNAIGLVITDIGNPFFTDVVRGVEDVAQQSGYTVMLGNTDEDPAKEAEYLRALSSKRVDGIILTPAGEAHELLIRLVRADFPLVFLDREVPGLHVPTVVLDGEAAAFKAVTHLIALGHRRIAMVAGRPRITSTLDRVTGYRRALDAAWIQFDPSLVVSGESRTEPARVAASTLLKLDPPPTAIFAANNLMTIGTFAAIEAVGLRVPDDIAVVGFDDFSWAGVFRPRLTTIAQPTGAIGRAAAEMLMRRIGHHEPAPERIVLQGELVVRDSCGARSQSTSVEPFP